MSVAAAEANISATSGVIAYGSLPPGSFALQLNNASNGQIPDNQIFVQIISLPNGQVSYVDATQTIVTGAPQGSGSLGTVEKASPNMPLPSFTLADLLNHTIYLPGNGQYYGSRIYISIGQPLSLAVNGAANGYVQPNVQNPNDPNYLIPFDWFEFTYDPAPQPNNPSLDTVAFGGNTTQVDGFSIPLSFTVTGVAGTSLTRGITVGASSSSGASSRSDLINAYLNSASVSAPFRALAQENGEQQIIRLISPYHSTIFNPEGTSGNYFDTYVSSVWRYYQSHVLSVYDQPGNVGNHYTGQVVGQNGQLVFQFYRNGVGPFYMSRPTTYDVLTCSGALEPGGTETNAFGAQLAAALNRHVATNSDAWMLPDNYYQQEPMNDWAEFWHSVSIGKLAYGFGFDDVANQSSVAVLPANENVFSLTLQIGW